jgi:N-acetylmuramoyl-L-alanine amidase
MKIIIDPGHGLSNRKSGVYDPGACFGEITEAGIVMDWANELRKQFMAHGHKVVRTRVNKADPAPVGDRAAIARHYAGELMISLHCNAATGSASGTETFYRGEANKALAGRLNAAVVKALGTRDRGVKTESESQHSRLAIMRFQPCFLIELGFVDNAGDRAKMLDPVLRAKACAAIVGAIGL